MTSTTGRPPAAASQSENASPDPGADPVSAAGYVYVLGAITSRGVRTYVGWTLDPVRRLAQHNGGTGAKSTRGYAWTLLYVERLDSRVAAMSREWHLKRDRRLRGELARGLAAAAIGSTHF